MKDISENKNRTNKGIYKCTIRQLNFNPLTLLNEI